MSDRAAVGPRAETPGFGISCLEVRAGYARGMGSHRPVEQAIILAAGRGSRLAPITDQTPKALVPFFGRPLIDFAAAHLSAACVGRIAVNTHHLGDRVGDYVRAELTSRYRDIEWTVSSEAELLGTGGALANLRSWLGDADFFVVNADAVFEADLRSLACHRETTGADAVWMVTREARYSALRVVATAPSGDLETITPQAEEDGSTFCGVHLASSGVLDMLPDGPSCVVRDGYLPWLADGARVATWETHGFWADTGTPDRYVDAHRRGLASLDAWRALGLFDGRGAGAPRPGRQS
jgi:mannose-1-phosphate guanylyltransferase